MGKQPKKPGLPAAVGRPSKYDPAFCRRVVELGEEGCSKAELASELGVTRNTLDNWAQENPEFLTALTRAHECSVALWEKQARTNLATQGFNAALYAKAMSGRFPQEAYRNQLDLKADVNVKEKRTLDPRMLEPEEREQIEAILQQAMATQPAGPDVIDGEFSEVGDDEG